VVATDAPPGVLGTLRVKLRDAASAREWAIEANDGIIATAGLLQGFAGAGASTRVLLFTATAATIAGGLSAGGANWAEVAAERDAQLLIVERERRELAEDPAGEVAELTRYWEGKGLSPDLAARVAEELNARNALAAQLEFEHGFTEPLAPGAALWTGVGTAAAYMVGASIPLLITWFAPVDVSMWAILGAVLVSLVVTALVSARAGRLNARQMVLRTLIVGAFTMIVSFIAGELIL